MAILRVALDVPLYRLFDYRPPEPAPTDPAAVSASASPPASGLAEPVSTADVGRLVRVPFARQRKIGVIVAVLDDSAAEMPSAQMKPVEEILRQGPLLPADWLALCEFAAAYYQAPLGETMLQMLPPALRLLAPPKRRAARGAAASGVDANASTGAGAVPPTLTSGQAAAVAAVRAALGRFAPFLLHGVTGSGKTEVYLRLVEAVLQNGGQALLLVPEINLTPQLEARIAARFAGVATVSLHSELGPAARARNWAAAASGAARIVLGTRLAVFTPLPDLQLIVIDEEHDASFKQQDGIRYSARDVAVFRARQRGIPIVLGSATPALETWANAQGGRYELHILGERAVAAAQLPRIDLVDTRREKLQDGLSSTLLAAIDACLRRGEQSLIFLNRRGYAPVLGCAACGWVSRCKRCAANLVLHLADRRLRCHHCGFETAINKACPDCGNQDIHPFGRGTQRLEENLTQRFPEARILRVDRDAAKSRRQWEVLAERIHAGDADILVGTQMLAKGHDFPRLTLVGVVGADAGLFAADWRAPERLFSQLMQVAGRAGRADLPGEVLVQTEHPEHPLYAALQEHDYARFAASQLKEREQAGFPPYAYQAMLRAEAPAMADAIAFLASARAWPGAASHAQVVLYDAVPMRLHRKASLERGQLMVESVSRPALQRFLTEWRAALESIKAPSRLRWHLEVDPLEC